VDQPTPVPVLALSPSPTSHREKLASTSLPAQSLVQIPEPVFTTNRQPNQGNSKKSNAKTPNLQSTVKYDENPKKHSAKPPTLQSTVQLAGKDNVDEESYLLSTAKQIIGKEGAEKHNNLKTTSVNNVSGKGNVEHNLSKIEGLESTTSSNNRPRFYCISNVNKINEECISGMECSEGNPCSPSQLCLQYDCLRRPPSNGPLDLCPFRYVGTYTKKLPIVL